MIYPQPGNDWKTWAQNLVSTLQSQTQASTSYIVDTSGRPIVTPKGVHAYSGSGASYIAPDIIHINTDALVNSAITTAKLANLSVDATKLAALAVDAGKLAQKAVTTTKIADAAVGRAAIGTAAVGTANIANAAITSALIGDLEVVTAKIADLAVNDAKVANLSAGKLTAGVIGAGQIYVGDDSVEIDGANKRILIQDPKTSTPYTYIGTLPDGSVGIQVLDSAGAVVFESSSIKNTLAAGTFIANAAITDAMIKTLVFNKLTDSSGTFIVNSAGQLKASYIETNAITIGSLAGSADWYTQIKNAPQSGDNIVNKSTFEDGTKGAWGGSTSVITVSGQPFTHVLQTTNRDAYEAGNSFPVKTGDVFYLGATMKAPPGYPIKFGILFKTSSGSDNWITAITVPANTGPQTLTGSITVPSGGYITGTPWFQINMPKGTANQAGWGTNFWIGHHELGADVTANNPTVQTTANWVRPNTTQIDGNKIYTGSAYVDTLQIKGHAITVPLGTTVSGNISVGNTLTTIATLSGVTSALNANSNILVVPRFYYNCPAAYTPQSGGAGATATMYYKVVTSSGTVLVAEKIADQVTVTTNTNANLGLYGLFTDDFQIPLSHIPSGDSIQVQVRVVRALRTQPGAGQIRGSATFSGRSLTVIGLQR